MGCAHRVWHRSLHPHARQPAHVRRQSSSVGSDTLRQTRAKPIMAPSGYTVGRTGPNGDMQRDRSWFAQSAHRLQISRRSHMGRTSQLRKLPLPPLPRTLRARHQRRIDLVACHALRCLETRIAMRLSGSNLRGLVRVNLFEPEHSGREQQM
jgi:hypothetical protein